MTKEDELSTKILELLGVDYKTIVVISANIFISRGKWPVVDLNYIAVPQQKNGECSIKSKNIEVGKNTATAEWRLPENEN